MKPDAEFDPLVDALRADLPNAEQSARLRTRLSALGIAATATSLASSTAAASGLAAKGASELGFAAVALSRVATWSYGVKVGLASAVVGSAVAGTALVSSGAVNREPPVRSARAPVKVSQPAPARAPVNGAAPRARVLEPVAASPVVEPPTRSEPPRKVALRAPAPVRAVAPADTSNRAAVAALPAADATAESAARARAATTLSEETALMDGAFAALRAGDSELANRFVLAHEQRFPNGLLNRERERARAVLLRSGTAP